MAWWLAAVVLACGVAAVSLGVCAVLGVRSHGSALAVSSTLGAVVLACIVLTLTSGVARRQMLPVPIGTVRTMACGVFRIARVAGWLMGCADEALRRSFLNVQNGLAIAWLHDRRPRRLLVLLPHCLEQGVRARIESVLERYHCTWEVVKGGTEALHAVTEAAPDGLLAVACERDLLNGVMSLGGRVPCVLVLPNIQGERPCRSTGVDLCRLEDSLCRLALPREGLHPGK